MSAEKFLTYRGDLRAIVGVGGSLAFVTAHPEGRPTPLYRLDADAGTLAEEPLPRGGVAIVAGGDALWISGGDGRLYRALHEGKDTSPRPFGPAFATPPVALALLADGKLAALSGQEITILSGKDGKALQTLELPEPGSCLASDPTGHWLATGTTKGTVAVFEDEGKDSFQPSAAEKLHEGAVTAIVFESDELRFLSAGADQKLLSTLARGRLEPEDRGRGANHTEPVPAIVWGPDERFYTGSKDATIKAWPRVGNARPSTIKDGLGRILALAVVHVHGRPRLVAACDDNSLRTLPIEPGGKPGEVTLRTYGALDWARHELAQDDHRRREAAYEALASWDDAAAVDLLAQKGFDDADHGLRLHVARALAASKHPRAAAVLERFLGHGDGPVRLAAIDGLRRHLGAQSLRPLDLALKAGQADVGRKAVEYLEGLAKADDQALVRLHAALDAPTADVRLAALDALERVNDPGSPAAPLAALGSKHADLRRRALIRLHERGLLDEGAVRPALSRAAEDADPDVRKTAFLLALYARSALLDALRRRDPELARQLAEVVGEKEKDEPAKKAKDEPAALADADYEPLLRATASRALDTSLRGARGLAVLGDPRAFGLLLQLSREPEPSARAEVCRALAELDDPRAIERLRSLLFDDQAEVRDAAFTALARFFESEPIRAAEAGLNAAAEDVRGRGLHALISLIRKSRPKGEDDASWRLLARALNDGAPAIRGEAFKAALNQQVGGGGERTLRFALQSVHADVRREAFNEATALAGPSGGWDLVLAFFDDPDPALRGDAFAFAQKKTKGLEFLEAALASRHPDVRKAAVEGLVKKHNAAAQKLLARALTDEDREVRRRAVDALVEADARPALAAALGGPHEDVRLRAARALARHGDPAAREPLLALATTPEPAEDERKKDWAARVEAALDGLGELGDPAALPAIIPLLDSPRPEIRKQAARALAWVARPESADALREALRHDDPQVKYHAALGLAYQGDPLITSLVFGEQAAKVLSVGEQIAAALTLAASGEDRLVAFLDQNSEQARSRALLLLMMLEWKDPQDGAPRCLAALSSRMPRMRLAAAQALEALAEPDGFPAFVASLVNDRGDKPPWKVRPAEVDALAELLVHAGPLTRARTARLIRHLKEGEEQASWDLPWKAHRARFADELATLEKRAKARQGKPVRIPPQELRELAFGAYVGLVREGGTPAKGKAAPDAAVVRVRQTALGRLHALAKADPRVAAAARPVFARALGDPNQAVRLQAFEQLQQLGMEPAALGAEALAAGHVDVGVKGLEALGGGAGTAEGQAVLVDAMTTRTDALAAEAARLLLERLGPVATAARALEAASEKVRASAVGWLAEAADREPAARERLREALTSRFEKVREAAAIRLAWLRDPAAFEPLTRLLAASNDPAAQTNVANALVRLGDPRTPAACLDRVENDPGGTAPAANLLAEVGKFRDSQVVDRLLALAESRPKLRTAALQAALVVSGFDQPIQDPDDEQQDRTWESRQHPRRVDVLARLIDRAAALGESAFLNRLIPQARWARGGEVDGPLAALANHPDEQVRRAAVQGIGWRLRKRGGPAEPLRKALAHGDAITQFLAAEGLALAGRGEGLNVLLAAIDFLNVLEYRRRAVEALGALGDGRALDTLLRLANEPGHALQEEAAEAIGRLGRSARSAEVSTLLERYARGDGGLAANALKGLRWLDTASGWRLIRERAEDESFGRRNVAIELLGYHDDPANRDLLLRLLAEDGDDGAVQAALGAARRLWGTDAIEPDLAALRNAVVDEWIEIEPEYDVWTPLLDRVRERAEPGTILDLLPHVPGDAVRDALATSLLNRPDPPVAEAKTAVAGNEEKVVGVAAHILGRAGSTAADAGPAVEAALSRWLEARDEHRRAVERGARHDDNRGEALDRCVRELAWAAGRLGAGRKALMALVAGRADDEASRTIRREAVAALAALPPDEASDQSLEGAATGPDPEARAIASQALGRRARGDGLAAKLLSDRVSFDRLARAAPTAVDGALREAARRVHDQGIALPHLVARREVEPLAGVAVDRALPDATRLGAVEALAAMAEPAAEDVLRRVGTAADEDEELRKAAWRGLRRSKRARARARAKIGAEVPT